AVGTRRRRRRRAVSARTLILLALLLAAVIGSRWLLDRPDTRAPGAAGGTAPEPGYYMRDATVLGTGRDGKPLYSLHAERIDEVAQGAGAELTNIELEYRAQEADPWHLRADAGRISADGQHIELNGNVVITELADDTPEPTRVRAPELTVDVAANLASTTARVRILRGGDFLDGTGMQAYLSEGRLLLEADVEGLYQP
ncbi:MAG: LPS export ABC transporter periplasmic protein LptC, partial [Pseudomonadota bacterium]